MTIVPVLDHVVINVRGELDAAAERYAALGFQLTERGHHTLGSSNNLAIFGTDYLELLGFEKGRENVRVDILKHPVGLTGLVFKTTASLELYEELKSRGVPVEEPAEFSRPVALPGGPKDAKFRVVRIADGAVQNGRTFFCHHFTPELVWRDEWRKHGNGVTGIAEFVIATTDPKRTSAIFAKMFGEAAFEPIGGGLKLQAGTPAVLFLTPDAIRARFGMAVEPNTDGSDRMVALIFNTASMDAARAAVAKTGAPTVTTGQDLLVPAAEAFGVALGFRS